ncbi:MAG: hypothetical protein V7607_6181 [Solirubrobacteraceae bacterium]
MAPAVEEQGLPDGATFRRQVDHEPSSLDLGVVEHLRDPV